MGESFPVVTLTTDFGLRDFYVAAMKAAVLRGCPNAALVDISHAVGRHDILAGSILLERALASFDAGAVHVGVIDPGVGTDRRIVVARWPSLGQILVCPDNGLLAWPWRRLGPAELFELTWRPAEGQSQVFHGRDIMAPAAGMLAAGRSIHDIARPAAGPVLLDVFPATNIRERLSVIHIDQFGNATTNLLAAALETNRVADVQVNGRSVGPLRRTYHDVPPGQMLALINSSDLLEIAVCEGSAGDRSVKVGDEVTVQCTP